MAEDQDVGTRIRLPPGARADAGFHRRAGGGRSRRHARRHEGARRRPQEDQSAGAGRSRHRSLGRGHLLRQQPGVQEERRRGIPAEPGALQIPEMGAALVRQFQRGAAGHRHLPPGQSRISVARGLEQEGQGQGRRQAGDHGRRLSGHGGRHQLAHHDGQWPLGARLGRRRHRGGSRHARPAAVDGAARGDRLQAVRQAQGGPHRHRPGAHRHRNAAQARRGRQVRRILRPRPHASDDRRPCHPRQYGAGIRRHLRLLADRRRHHQVPQGHQPSAGSDQARGGLRQGAGNVPRQDHARSDLHRHPQTRSSHRRAVAVGPEAPAGPNRAARCQGRFHRFDGEGIQQRQRAQEARAGRPARTTTSAMATW